MSENRSTEVIKNMWRLSRISYTFLFQHQKVGCGEKLKTVTLEECINIIACIYFFKFSYIKSEQLRCNQNSVTI